MRTRANKGELFKKTDICLIKRTFLEGMRIPPARKAATARQVRNFDKIMDSKIIFLGSAYALRGYGVMLGSSSSHDPFFSRKAASS